MDKLYSNIFDYFFSSFSLSDKYEDQKPLNIGHALYQGKFTSVTEFETLTVTMDSKLAKAKVQGRWQISSCKQISPNSQL